MKSKQRSFKILLIVIILAIIISLPIILKTVDTQDFTKYNLKNSTETTGEIVIGRVIHQEFTRPYKKLDGLSLQFANYSDRPNKGIVNIRVYDNHNRIASVSLDASKIEDGQFIRIPFEHKVGDIGSKMAVEVTSPNSTTGSAVTLWMSQNKQLTKIGGKLKVDNVETSQNLHMKLEYFSPKVNFTLWIALLIVIWFFIPLGLAGKIITKYQSDMQFRQRVKSLLRWTAFIVVGFVLLSLRDLSFLTSPSLYAEDAAYLSNIFEHGFWNSVFMTRGGGDSDFQNSGSYILLFLALKTTSLFCGYDLSSLPTFVGVYANLFWSCVACVGYYAFRFKGRMMGITAFSVIIFIPMGTTGAEVFGRVLNTVFIWPLLVCLLLMIQYRNRFTMGSKSIAIGLICILAGLSFPVSYGVVGIYLIFCAIRAIREKNLKKWISSDWLICISIIIGLLLLPHIIKSKGITGDMTLKPDAIFEFIIARHVLFPFIQLFYTHLNDKITSIIFIVYAGTILYAVYLNTKRKGFFSDYTYFTCTAVGVILSSALMRIKMTSLFNEYQTTFPDRYFYACNAFSILALFYAIYIILNHRGIKTKYLSGMISLLLLLIISNPYLFEFKTPVMNIHGAKDMGDFQDCVTQAVEEKQFNGEFINVTVYPVVPERAWLMYIPISNALATLK